MTEPVEAKDVRYAGPTIDQRASNYRWTCGKCGWKHNTSDDFIVAERWVNCSRCDEMNHITFP